MFSHPAHRRAPILCHLLAALLAWPWAALGSCLETVGVDDAPQSVLIPGPARYSSSDRNSGPDVPLAANLSPTESDDEDGEQPIPRPVVLIAANFDLLTLHCGISDLVALTGQPALAPGPQQSQRLRC
jgi:hypothetical protein